MSQRDGGAAFPCHPDIALNGYVGDPGMRLRDYFAAAAVQGYLASFPSTGDPVAYNIAVIAYEIADAMLKVREVDSE